MIKNLYTLFILIGLTLSLSVNAEDKVYPNLTATGGTYELVTDESQIEDGGIYLFADLISTDFYVMSSFENGKFSTVRTQNVISIPASLKFDLVNSAGNPSECVLEEVSSGKWCIRCSNGQYISNTRTDVSSGNSMAFVSSKSSSDVKFIIDLDPTLPNGATPQWKFENKNARNVTSYFGLYNNNNNKVGSASCSGSIRYSILYKKQDSSSTPSSSTAPFTMSTARYASLYYSDKDVVLPAGLTAYTYSVSNSGSSVYLTPSHTYVAGDKIPAGVAVVVKGEPGTYQLTLETPDNSLEKPENTLLGCDTETELDNDADKYFFKLSLNDNKELGSVGFYWANEDGSAFTTQAHKAYLVLDKLLFASGEQPQAKKIIMIETPAATGVTSANISGARREKIKSSDALGRNISGNAKGLVIRNGKKYIQK